ncbi:ABC transporter permease subunit [candidate division WOR-3 bacterium]|nr:ABC transporter permease subunit [candidate division WOR-3 bacterium]
MKKITKQSLVTFSLLSPGLLAIGCLFFYPLFIIIKNSLAFEEEHIFYHYIKFLSSSNGLYVIGLTCLLAFGATFLSICLSILLILILRRKPIGHNFFKTLVLAPITIPGLICALGLLLFWDKNGWMNLIIQGIINRPIQVNYTIPGLLIFYTWLFFPYTFLITFSQVESLDKSIEEAAEVVGANRMQVLRYILLPLAKPGLLAGSIITFMLCFGAFSVPLICGGDYRPLSVSIYTTSAIYNRWDEGSAMAVIMALIQIFFLISYIRIMKRAR